jgi:dCTP deaminase
MGVYSNLEIREAVKKGQIVLYPLNEKHIAGSSVDLTLGYYFYRLKEDSSDDIYNPFDKTQVEKYFEGPFEATPHAQWCKEHHHPKFTNIPDDQPIIVLKPGERILAHTGEFIGIKPPGTSMMKARSTWGRNGVAVCFDAGWGDPGYINRWTMEVYNINQHRSVVLPVGERIAQLVFFKTGDVEGEYTHLSGKYQKETSGELEKIIANWRPEQMLPRAWVSERELPVKIEGLSKGLK